jgi:hypothetical protein
MQIELKEITVRELVEGYKDNAEFLILPLWIKLDT